MENKKIYGYVYLITNLINGKQYIGQTVRTIKKRFDGHISKKNPVISKAIKKYGRKNFEIKEIDVAYNQKELNLIEGVYISWFKTLAPNGYNITKIINGKGKHSEETIKKIKTKANTLERLKKSSEYGKKNRGISYKKSSSKYIGVSISDKKYKAGIGHLCKYIRLGTYDSEIDAAKAYDIAAIKYFGNDCVLNFPELRNDYIYGKIIVKKTYGNSYAQSGQKNITFIKNGNYWRFKWFSKILNRNTSKFFKTLEETINFKNEKILDKDYLEFKSNRKID